MRRRQFVAALGASTVAAPAIAQPAWPSKPIRMVIPYPPGGPSDVSTRIVLEHAARGLGQPVVFDNKAGASGMIGAEFVKNQPVDDHTFLTTTTAMVCITRHLQAIPFDPEKDFVTVSRMTTSWGVMALNPAVPARTVPEFVAYAKANPGKINFGSSGMATITHLFGEMLSLEAGIKMTHVPYRGTALAVGDLLGGQLTMVFSDPISVLPHIKSGKLRALATTGAKRDPALPDVPTIAEAGVKGYESGVWFGISVPAATPKEIIARLNKASVEATKSPEFIKRMTDLGYNIIPGTPEQMASMLKDELTRWAPIVKASGAKVD